MAMVPNPNGQGASRQLVELIKDASGVWSTQIPAMAPELYGYSFIVDGVTTLDPSNLKVARDGTFRTESLLYVAGPASDLYWSKTGPKGSMHQVWYDSKSLNLTRRMQVYTPPGWAYVDELASLFIRIREDDLLDYDFRAFHLGGSFCEIGDY